MSEVRLLPVHNGSSAVRAIVHAQVRILLTFNDVIVQWVEHNTANVVKQKLITFKNDGTTKPGKPGGNNYEINYYNHVDT